MSAWADNPQAAEINSLVKRAGELPQAEIEALHVAARTAARAAAWASAWASGRDAAWDAAGRDAALAAGRYAAWDAALAAARDEAWAADRDAAGRYAAWAAARTAEALVARDLIDETTPWNQAAYDLLTAPWRRVIGPIHPDDEVLR